MSENTTFQQIKLVTSVILRFCMIPDIILMIQGHFQGHFPGRNY